MRFVVVRIFMVSVGIARYFSVMKFGSNILIIVYLHSMTELTPTLRNRRVCGGRAFYLDRCPTTVPRPAGSFES